MPYPVGSILNSSGDSCLMAKPNYAFAKRQRDLAKKKKKEDKRLRKSGTEGDAAPEPQTDAGDAGPASS
jgi:hypothetical protein